MRLQFEAMNVDRVKTKLSVAYIDYNITVGSENADDHLYIQTIAETWHIFSNRVTAYAIRYIWRGLECRAIHCLAPIAIRQLVVG